MGRSAWRNALGPGILASALCAGASAQTAEFVSQYTTAELRKCRKFERVQVADSEVAASWVCKGLAGYVVVVGDNDLRATVSVGRNIEAAAREPAANQSFGPFNFAYETVEWRNAKGSEKPFAVIQRWNISDSENPDRNGRPGRNALLVVTRLPPGPVCHVAYIDAKANRGANVLARQAADEIARGFDCAKDQVRVVGARGRATELAGR